MINFKAFNEAPLMEQCRMLLEQLGLTLNVEHREDLIDRETELDAIVLDSKISVIKARGDQPGTVIFTAFCIGESPGTRLDPPTEDFVEIATTDKADLTLLRAIEAAFTNRVSSVLDALDTLDPETPDNQ